MRLHETIRDDDFKGNPAHYVATLVCFVTSEFCVDKILWCDSNETYSAVLSRGNICFSPFSKLKFGIFAEV